MQIQLACRRKVVICMTEVQLYLSFGTVMVPGNLQDLEYPVFHLDSLTSSKPNYSFPEIFNINFEVHVLNS